MKEKGGSTLGGRQVWFIGDILRLNYDGRGEYLGEFHGNDQILVIMRNGDFIISNATNHYEADIMIIEKYDSGKTWTAALNDADEGYPYLKRFKLEPTQKRSKIFWVRILNHL